MKLSILPVLLLCPIYAFGYTFEPIFTTDGQYQTISLYYDENGNPIGDSISFQMIYIYDPVYNQFVVGPSSFSGDWQYENQLNASYDNVTLKYMFDWMGGWYSLIKVCPTNEPCDENSAMTLIEVADNQWQILTDLESQYVEYLITHPNDYTTNIGEILDGLIFDDDIALVKNAFVSHLVSLPANRQAISAVLATRHIMRQQNTTITKLAFDRFGKPAGRNGGDSFGKFSTWGQTTYSHAKQTGNNSFTGDTFGVVLGADTKVSDSVLFGFGYNYNTATVATDLPNLDIKGHTIFAYGQYHPKELFFNAMVGYNTGNYTDDHTNTKGDLSGFVSSIMMGYDASNGLSPQMGARCNNISIKPNDHNIAKYNSDIFTIVSGLGYEYKPTDTQINLKSHIFMTYDLIQADSDIKLAIPALQYTYTTTDVMPRLGTEAGVKLEMPLGDCLLSAGYDLTWHSHYINHMGSLRLRYEF